MIRNEKVIWGVVLGEVINFLIEMVSLLELCLVLIGNTRTYCWKLVTIKLKA